MRRTKQRLALAVALVGLSLAGAAAAAGQQPTGTVVGQVTDAATMSPLASAQVFVPGTQRGALTNADGRYVIHQVPVGARTIKVTVLGYAEGTRSVTVSAAASVTANFALAQSAVELNAVVVSAMTGQKERKAQIGANVTNINTESLNKAQVSTFADVLNGRTAGVDLKSVTGTVGGSQKIRIRGANSLSLSNEPVIYVDGVLYDNSNTSFGAGGQDVSRLNDLNPEEIANIEVLKGPAASAMYGTAAANGVLLITTKRGKAGAPRWSAYAETGSLQDKTAYPSNYLTYQALKPGAPLLTATGSLDRTARKPCYTFQAAAGSCTQDSVLTFNTLRDARTTPFINGFRNNFGLNVAGGNDAATYFISGDWQREQGVITYNTNNQINLRSNVDAHLRPNLDVNVSAGYTTGQLVRPNGDNSVLSPLINGFVGTGTFYPALADGSFNRRNFGWNLAVADLANYLLHHDVNHLVLGSTTNYRPFSWLSGNMTVGLDRSSLHESDTYQPQPAGYTMNAYFTQDKYGNAIGEHESRQSEDLTYLMTTSGTATFDLRPNLNSSTTAGVSYNKNHYYSTYGYGAGIVAGTENLSATSSLFAVSEGYSELVQIGGFAQEKLAYNDRIFLSAGMRTDDNSAFGKRYGRIYYPSVSLSWVISQEPFFPRYDWLNSVRLRSAWGQSGLRPNFRQAVTYFSSTPVTVGGADLSGVTLSATGNELLKPERTTEYELGGDVGVLNERVSAEFTYYHKRSQDALISKPLPPSLGLTASMFDNLGSIQNKGMELSVKALALNTRLLQANLTLTATTLDNKVLDLGKNITPIAVGRNQRHAAGFPAGGFWQKDYTFSDANHDGKIYLNTANLKDPANEIKLLNAGTPADSAVYLGPALPTFSRSIAADVTVLKNITISTLFDWRGGNHQYNMTEAFRCQTAQNSFGERGCFENMDPKAPVDMQARYLAYRYFGSSAGFVEKADFVKWRELSVTLTPPTWLTQRAGVAKNASITFAGRNLHTWTKYTGIDPEINEAGSGSNFGQDEFNTQPPLRFYTVRLNYTF